MDQALLLAGTGWVLTMLLLSVRIATTLLFTPMLHAVAMPGTVRALFILGLACVLAMPFSAVQVEIGDPGALVQALLREAAVGATLGLGVMLAFSGFTLAGHLIDLQIGFGMAQVFDPATRAQVPVLSAAFGLLAAVFFFLVEGHHALMRGLAYSVERFPVGQAWALPTAAAPLLRQAAGMFSLGFALAAPVVLSLLLVEFVLGAISRNLPQMNMLVLGLPVKIVVGLLVLSLWATGFGPPAARLYAGIYEAWNGWFQAEVRR